MITTCGDLHEKEPSWSSVVFLEVTAHPHLQWGGDSRKGVGQGWKGAERAVCGAAGGGPGHGGQGKEGRGEGQGRVPEQVVESDRLRGGRNTD